MNKEISAAQQKNDNVDAIVSPVDLPDSLGSWIKRVVYGALVGVGAILPGVSGGAFCAAFGIYRPMMDFFAHPGKNFRKNLKFFLPFGIGCALGFVLLAKLVGWLLGLAAAIVTAFFIGCILGTMPSLYKEANGAKWNVGHWAILLVSTALAFAGLIAMKTTGDLQSLIADPKSLTYVITWLVCGAIFSLGSIVPGMSPSSIIMCANLYKPMSDGIGNFQLDILLPFVLGAVLCIILFSKLISLLFNKAGRSMFAFIIGVVIASTLLLAYDHVIMPLIAAASPLQWIGSAVSAVAGFVAVILLAKLDPR